jgi:hypothetical protein
MVILRIQFSDISNDSIMIIISFKLTVQRPFRYRKYTAPDCVRDWRGFRTKFCHNRGTLPEFAWMN